MGGARWADIVDESELPSVPKPLTVSLSSRKWAQCAESGASFYLNARGKPRRFCRECFHKWAQQPTCGIRNTRINSARQIRE